MNIKLNISKDWFGQCVVTREPQDKKIYGRINASGESKLLHIMKKELAKQGFDFIKKRMWKDGHLMDDLQQYLRERKPKKNRCLCIFNGHWAINGAEEDFNAGEAVFIVENLAGN